MAEPDLAPSNGDAGKQTILAEDPFTSPALLSSTYPTPSRPCGQPPYSAPLVRTPAVSSSTDMQHDRSSQHATNDRSKPGSPPSTAESTIMTPASSIYLEKAALAKVHKQKRSGKESKRSKDSRASRDPEKAMTGGHNNSSPSRDHGVSSTVAYMEEDDELDVSQRTQSEKAVRIVLFLSGPCVILSSMNTAWACLALVITMLSQPIRMCAKRPTFGQQLAGLLGPTLNLQLRCIYTPLPPYANEDASYHTFVLFVVHLLSPFLSFVMMFAAWTLAVYWLSSAVVGDPGGQDKRDDGKEFVLVLRRWWESWLMRSVKGE